MTTAKDKYSPYLIYLDKEMTIMGILSTFCIVALGFTINWLLGKDSDPLKLYEPAMLFAIIGFVSFFMAGFSFYRQRALLAWYYGQISLYVSLEDDKEVISLMKESDGWNNWVWYQRGFFFQVSAFLQFLSVLLNHTFVFTAKQQIFIAIFVLAIVLVIGQLKINAYRKFPYSEFPEKNFRKSILK